MFRVALFLSRVGVMEITPIARLIESLNNRNWSQENLLLGRKRCWAPNRIALGGRLVIGSHLTLFKSPCVVFVRSLNAHQAVGAILLSL